MGLVDKTLESFKSWTVNEVELLPGATEDSRQAYKRSVEDHKQAILFEAEARDLSLHAGNTPTSTALYNDATAARVKAKDEEKKAKKTYDEMVKRHNARLHSLSQTYDTIFRSHNIRKEHYHGGKCNGVNCIRIMEKSEELFIDFSAAIREKKVPTVTDDEVNLKCQQCARLFGLLDVIWSNVRGVDAGLLPTESQIQQLRDALLQAKQVWIDMDIGTRQPKWHLTFDSHLLQQVIRYGGLADKSDETIELQHQQRMKLKDRYRSITSYAKRESCIRRELRRQKSPEINRHIDHYKDAIRRNPESKRQLDFAERHQEQREAKKVKREAILES